MILCDQRLDALHRDAGVVAAEMGDRRALRRLVLELRRHHAAVIGGGRREIGADLRHPPRDRATVAIAGDEDRSLPLQRVDAGRSEEHTSELQSLMRISYAVFCLKKKKINKHTT